MVYYAELNSLLLFGGLRSDVRRFAQLSDLMFQFDVKSQTWVRLQLDKYSVERNYVPAERAFHSAQIMGNYMVVFGGFSHKHNQVETCQDKNLYFFHLGCMTWVRFYFSRIFSPVFDFKLSYIFLGKSTHFGAFSIWKGISQKSFGTLWTYFRSQKEEYVTNIRRLPWVSFR